MSRRQKEPLRTMTEEEEAWLHRIARATREPANHVIRAKQLVAVAAGQSYSQAATCAGVYRANPCTVALPKHPRCATNN